MWKTTRKPKINFYFSFFFFIPFKHVVFVRSRLTNEENQKKK